MLRFLLRRLLWFVITLLVVISVSFVLMRQVKGGPFDAERSLHPAIERNIKARYHLDWPLWKQFVQYVGPLNLDRDGARMLSRRDPARRLEQVTRADGSRVLEGVPVPIPHLHGVDGEERARLEHLVDRLAVGSAGARAELLLSHRAAGSPEAGESPVLAPLMERLRRTLPGAVDPDGQEPPRDLLPAVEQAALSASLEYLIEEAGLPPGPAPESQLPDLGQASGEAPAGDAGHARVRSWFGWYYANGGQVLWNTGSRPFTGVLTGDFGPSFRYRDYTVNQILEESLPISVRLGVLALAWALALGVTAGLVSALRRGGSLDLTLRLAATTGIALPNFVIGFFLIILFVFRLELLPVAGWSSLRHMVLPSLALGAPFAAYIARLTRTGMLESLSADHIRTARAKGVSPTGVVLRHALKGGILPVISYLGPATAGILTGSLVIERIFFIPGTGSHFVNSALSRDYTLAMGVTILYTVLVYTLNTIVDLAYTFLDPRIELDHE